MLITFIKRTIFFAYGGVAVGTKTNKQKHRPPERFPDTSATRTRSARSPAAAAETELSQRASRTLITGRCEKTRSSADLHLPGQVLVFIPDDGQRRLLAQGVGAISEGALLRRRGGRRTPDLLVAQTVAAFVGA